MMVMLIPVVYGCGSLAAAPIDVDYRLMELAAGGPSRADGAFLATLLSPLALTPDPLDYLFPWMLLQALQAIAAIPEAAPLDEVRLFFLLLQPQCSDIR